MAVPGLRAVLAFDRFWDGLGVHVRMRVLMVVCMRLRVLLSVDLVVVVL